jgi:hypothetical protein
MFRRSLASVASVSIVSSLLSGSLPIIPALAHHTGAHIQTAWDKIPDFCTNPTKTAAASGNWSQASTWTPTGVPGSSDVVIIPAGRTVTYELGAGGADCIGIHGTLSMSRSVSTSLKVGNLLVYSDGTFDAGTTSSPIPANALRK